MTATFVVVLGALMLAGCSAPSTTPHHAGSPSAAASQVVLLNSERIERTFGSYGVEVLESNSRVRVSNLFSLEEGRRVCRTFAVVVFPAELDPRLAAEHQMIADGGSIGAVFKSRGWSVGRRHRLIGEIAGPGPEDRLFQLMGAQAGELSGAGALALEVYALIVSRPGVALEYATIAEIHHPDHLALADLHAMYGHGVEGGGDEELAELLELVVAATKAPGAAARERTP